jgi:hypothetical protein
MKCPYCEENIKLPDHGINMFNVYGKAIGILTRCCYQPVDLIPPPSFTIEKTKDKTIGGVANPDGDL